MSKRLRQGRPIRRQRAAQEKSDRAPDGRLNPPATRGRRARKEKAVCFDRLSAVRRVAASGQRSLVSGTWRRYLRALRVLRGE